MVQTDRSSQRKCTGLILCLLMLAPALFAEWGEWPCLYKRGYIESNLAQESPVNIGQLQSGAPLPGLTAYTLAGKPVSLNEVFKQKPTAIFSTRVPIAATASFSLGRFLAFKTNWLIWVFR